MDEKDWSCLAAILEEKNLTHASEKLYTSQPALTYRIRELEKELGIKIFIKGKGSVKFTNEGILLAQYAKKMLIELNILKESLANMSLPNNAILNITAGEIFAYTELPDILKKFHQLHPNATFNITSINPNNILESLINADSHITIVRSELDWNGPKLSLRKDPIYVISKEAISMNELLKRPRILFTLTNSTKKVIDSWWQEYFSIPPQIGMKVTRSETCLEMIRQNFGYTIGPLYPPQRKDLEKDLYLQPLRHKNGTPLELDLYAYYREEVAEISIVKSFIKFLKHYFSLQSKTDG